MYADAQLLVAFDSIRRTPADRLRTALKHGAAPYYDELLVEYYKLTNDVMKRQQMSNRLYRMGSKELIFSVPGKKGGIFKQRAFGGRSGGAHIAARFRNRRVTGFTLSETRSSKS